MSYLPSPIDDHAVWVLAFEGTKSSATTLPSPRPAVAGVLRHVAVVGLFADVVLLVVAMALGGVEGNAGRAAGALVALVVLPGWAVRFSSSWSPLSTERNNAGRGGIVPGTAACIVAGRKTRFSAGAAATTETLLKAIGAAILLAFGEPVADRPSRRQKTRRRMRHRPLLATFCDAANIQGTGPRSRAKGYRGGKRCAQADAGPQTTNSGRRQHAPRSARHDRSTLPVSGVLNLRRRQFYGRRYRRHGG